MRGGASVVRHCKRCRAAGHAGRCKGRFGSLRGTYREEIGIAVGPAVRVRSDVSVERGRVNVSVASPEDDVTSVEVTPRKPALVEGVARVDADGFVVTFEAVGGKARDITYTLEFRSEATG
jgi:hypothetical protein